MKLFKTLSTLSVVLLTTFANANTTAVTTAELNKVQPINAVDLLKNVELDLAISLQQIKVATTKQTYSEHSLLASQAKESDTEKVSVAKLTLAAE